MKDRSKLSLEGQHRLNKKLVQKEVLKLLDVSIIYPILDSSWVSLVYVMLKKGESQWKRIRIDCRKLIQQG